MSIWNEFKQHTALGILFVIFGFAAGLGTYQYLSGFFNTEVVVKGSYISRADIEKQYVSIEKYTIITNEYKSFKDEVKQGYVSEKIHSYVLKDLSSKESALKNLRKEYNILQGLQKKTTSKVCSQNNDNIDSLVKSQEEIENWIEKLVSKHDSSYSKKSEDTINGDLLRAEQQRIYSQQLNVQLINLYKERAQCIK